MFWANLLQHQLNYPPSKFTYSRQRTSTDGGRQARELLQLTVEDEGVSLFVDMTTGVLTVSGQFVYDWFTIKFRQLLENVDEQFARDWVFVPTPAGGQRPPPPRSDHQSHQYEKTGHWSLKERL